MEQSEELEIEYEDTDIFLKESFTFEEYTELYKKYKNGEYIIEPINDINGLRLSDFTCTNRDFLFCEDSFNAAEYFEILSDYRREFYIKMWDIQVYFEQMAINKIVKIKYLPGKIDHFLQFMFECFEKINSIEGETQNGINERSYMLSSIIYYSFNNLYNIILETEDENIMGINNNDRFNKDRYIKFDIRNSFMFKP